MFRRWTRSLFFSTAFPLALLACSTFTLVSGCASGGFKLTRQYAGWVNKQNIILRIVLYLLTGVVYAVTLLIDFVVFNTMDFWEGRVSDGTYNFKGGDKTYQVRHEHLPGSNLKRSTIQISGPNNIQLQEVVLSETTTGEIELYVDGKLQAQVRDITSFPVATLFDQSGKILEEKILWTPAPTLTASHPAKIY